VPGNDPDWIRKVYGFALKPDRIFLLRAGVDDLVARVLQEGISTIGNRGWTSICATTCTRRECIALTQGVRID
jgi:hypothetical protein